jgi:lipopolysaccharide/colanic/teichoic acid biosynthesis glycosyltransferase
MTPPQTNDAEAVINTSHYYPNAAPKEIKELFFYTITKRFMDVTASAAGLILLAPLFILLAILTKVEDPRGTVFFSQVRIGKNEKPFRMYKFRSMVSDAEDKLNNLLVHNEISGAMFKMKDDPRITKIGKFIRKTSIDELPQLFNVLRGEMSLVGPRPPLPREVDAYTDHDKQRLTVTPGCTGLWQVSGRNELNFGEMVELDLEYIDRRNVFFDLKIIFKTVKVLIGSSDAY